MNPHEPAPLRKRAARVSFLGAGIVPPAPLPLGLVAGKGVFTGPERGAGMKPAARVTPQPLAALHTPSARRHKGACGSSLLLPADRIR